MEQLELEIINVLIKFKEIHVRKIAKLINSPHANVSRSLKTLLKKNIVDFNIEGKNKIFRLKKGIESQNYIYIVEHNKLLKLMEKYPKLSIIVDSILEKTNEKLIIIFGLYAKFIAKSESDIDVFIRTNNRRVKREIEGLNSKLSVKIGKFDKNNLIVKEIIKDHVIIRGVENYYEKNKLFT